MVCLEAWLRESLERQYKGKGVQESRTLFKEEILEVQEQTIPMGQKTSWWGRPAWLNREL